MAPRWRKLRTEPLVPGSELTRVVLPYDARQVELISAACGTATATSGTTEKFISLAAIEARPYPFYVEVSAFMSAINSVSGDGFIFRVYVNSVEKGRIVPTHSGASVRMAYAIPTSDPVLVAKNTSGSLAATVQRNSGTGTLTVDVAGFLVARIYPQVD